MDKREKEVERERKRVRGRVRKTNKRKIFGIKGKRGYKLYRNTA